MRSAQLPLDLGHVAAVSAADFLVTDSNAEAHEWIARWPAWPAFALALVGPAGAGKSHLANIFGQASGALFVRAAALAVDEVAGLAEAPSLVVEDADRGVDERALLHLYNLARERGRSLLLTGREPPARWTVALPDLRSRLAAIPIATIRPPDDRLLEALLVKLFADRQLRVGPEVMAFLLPRMERSGEAARAVVAAIDAAALSRQRAVTVPLVREVLGLGEPGVDHG